MTGIILNLTFTVTISAILILLIKHVLGNKAAPRWQLLIWTVLAVQLIAFPFSDSLPQSRLSIRNYMPETQNIAGSDLNKESSVNKIDTDAADGFGEAAEAIKPDGTIGNEIAGGSVQGTQGEFGANAGSKNKKAAVNLGTEDVIAAIWLAGMVTSAVLQAVRYARCRKSISMLPACEDAEVLEIFEECKNMLGIKKDIPIYTGAESTMLVGIFKPSIYIKEDFEQEELKYVIMHELCHYKHKDVIWNMAAAVYFAVFWFDPVIWLAFRTFRRDIEMYCDDRALSAMASGSRREYARVLVKSAAGSSGFVLATSSFIGGEKEVTARVKRIANSAKPKALFSAAAALLAALTLIACTTGALAEKPQTESVLVGTYGHQVNVPADWLSDMRTVSAGEASEASDNSAVPEYYYGAKQFYDKKGNLFAEIYNASSIYTSDEISSALSGLIAPYPSIDEETAKKAIVRHLTERGFTEITEQALDFAKDDSPMRAAAFTAVMDGKNYNIAAVHYDFLVMIADAVVGDEGASTDGAMPHTVSADELSLDALASYLSTVRSMDSPQNDIALNDIDEFVHGNYELTEKQYAAYAEKALGEYFAALSQRDLPVESKIAGCKVKSLERILPENERPINPSVFLGSYYDNAAWDVIYPKARAYKVTCELTPYSDKYFDGGRIKEEIAVFAVNDYIKDEGGKDPQDQFGNALGEFYFVGFVDSETSDYYGTDSAVLDMLNNWYVSLNPVYPSQYRTDYIGDAAMVGKIVNALPLHEYIDTSDGMFDDKAIVIRTNEEPYEIIVNYTFGENPPLDTTDDFGATPVSTRSRQVLSSNLNAFVADWAYTNIGRIFSSIGNVGIVTVNLNYEEDGVPHIETISMSHDDFNLL